MHILKFIILTMFCSLVFGDVLNNKVSLTFVIDDTGSMSDDIDQVIKGSNAIFDTVLNSEKSQIDNFVLVTFNDPFTKIRSTTKDRDIFKTALSSIIVDGGGDCAEYSMSGIKEGLENSLPGSYLYVFTDASAKDYELYEEVENMATKLRSQIVFVLTGMCGSEKAADYQVYHKIAKATSGEVFHLEKQDIKDILNYVRYTIEGPTTLIASKSFPPGYGHKFNYSTDVKTKDPLISVTGENPEIDITGPDGTKPATERLVDKEKIAIVKLTDAKPGLHTVEVGSKSNTSVKVMARSEVQFTFGFSTFIPSTIKDLTTRPVPGKKSYVSIKIIEGDIEMKTVKIMNMDENEIDEIPLSILDNKEKLYVTNMTDLPKTMFKIAFTGYDSASGTIITRIASSPVEPQRVTETVNKPPKVTISEEKISAVYDDPLQFVCKVRAFPKPYIKWMDKKGAILTANVSVVELPYDYISILNIGHAKINDTYYCKASNELGEESKQITVEVSRRHYMKVLEKPKDTEIEYNKQGELFCKVDSYPETEIKWYKDGKVISSSDSVKFYDKNSVLIINNMKPDHIGTYLCEIRNDDKRNLLQAKVSMSGADPPLIDKNITKFHVELHSDIIIPCRLLNGKPRPSIVWYYKSKVFNNVRELNDLQDEDSITVPNAQKTDIGTFICEAINDIGKDHHEIELIVDYPPTIKADTKYIRVREGHDVLLSCDADGEPTPNVVWLKNYTTLFLNDNDKLYKNNSLRMNSLSRNHIGNYTCIAENSLGSAERTVMVAVYVPVKIIPPKKHTLHFKVGNKLLLLCHAEGFPKPQIKWSYQSFNSNVSHYIKHELSSPEPYFSLIDHIQINEEGYYKCNARNDVSNDSITYEVHVLAPPVIENTYTEKLFQPVEGDLALRINCKASGNPKPVIQWLKDGLYVAIGDYYNIENGTLVIKNVGTDVSGVYVCEAKNVMGIDSEMYEVEVKKSPRVISPAVTVLIEYGTTLEVECRIPHKKTDRLRWYKHGQLMLNGDLIIANAEVSHSGIYTCRVSDFFKSKSESVRVQVGYKPMFVTKEKEQVEMVPGGLHFLNCEARGIPKPEITWWFNKAKVNSSEMVYSIDYSLKNKGVYYCNVKNSFGSIYRRFIVSPRDCVIELNKIKSNLQPLMLSSAVTWPKFHVDDGYLIIPKDDYFTLFCPNTFMKFPRSYVTAFCDGGSRFKINGISHEYSDIECTNQYNYAVKTTDEKCLPGNTETIKVVFEVLHESVEVYEVCFDKDKKMAIYTKHYMPRVSIGADSEGNWMTDEIFDNVDFDEIYKCDSQILKISQSLERWFHRKEKCCFRKRQLVNQKDVFPGIGQRAVFSYLNVVPQWSTCHDNNWDEVESSVRLLSKNSISDLLVWSGVSGNLELNNSHGTSTAIYLSDLRSNIQPVPKFLWKVIQNPATRSSLAIIQVNVPDLTSSEIHKHVLCPNICNRVEWMNGSNWNNVDNGFVYCCSLREFEKAFGFRNVFEPHYKILRRVASFAL